MRRSIGSATITVFDQRPKHVHAVPVPEGRLLLLAVQDGGLDVPVRGGKVGLRSGQGVAVVGARAIRMSTSSRSRTTAVELPVPDLVAAAVSRRSLHIVDNPPVLRPMAEFISALAEGERSPALADEHMEGALQKMLDAALASVVSRRNDADTALEKALLVIELRHRDPSLTATAVANQINVSLRQLEREFHGTGRTIRREIRRARVLTAASMLRNPAWSRHSIDSIALQAGFSNGSSLARAMASEEMPSPRRVRSPPAVERGKLLLPE